MSKSNQNRDESLKIFRQLISQYDQEIIQPVINEILANFEHDPSKFQASVEAWRYLSLLKTKLFQNYDDLEELIKNGYIKSKLVEDEINSFFVQDKNDVDLLYQYKEILSSARTKSSVLIKFIENGQKYKPVHFIFAFVSDTQMLEQLINAYNLNINEKIQTGSAPIHFAAEMGNKEGFELLINKYHVDVNVKDDDQYTPLHYVATEGYIKLLKIFLQNSDIEINAQTERGNTPLHLAVLYGWPQFTDYLIVNGANFDIDNNNQFNALDIAATVGYIEIFKTLFPYFQKRPSFHIDKSNSIKLSLLSHAIYGDSERMVKSLVKDFTANIDKLTLQMIHPLLGAIERGNEPITKYLLECGCMSLTFLITYYKDFANMAINQSPSPITAALSMFEDRQGPMKKTSEFIGIFNNKWHIIDIIDNWHKFTPSLRREKDFIDNNDNKSITAISNLKIDYLKSVIVSITDFFVSRQAKLILKDNYNSNFTNLTIDRDELERNLLYKAVLNKIMSGDIRLHDENKYSEEIIRSLNKCIKIFLFHESKFLNENFEFEAKLIHIPSKTLTPDLHLMNQDNYRAMKFWENDNFLEMICLKKKGHELTVYIKQLNLQKNEESEEQNVDNNCLDELGTMVWGSKYLVTIITSHLSLEGYYNSLKMAAKEEVPLVAQDSFVDQS